MEVSCLKRGGLLLPFLAVPVVSLANPPEMDLEPVVVTAPAPPLTLQNRSAVPFDADPMTLPQSVGTIPAELLDRQDARSLSDAVTNVPGVLVAGRVVRVFTIGQVEEMIGEGIITGGMIPKVRSAAEAVVAGVYQAVITDLDGLAQTGGTAIVK